MLKYTPQHWSSSKTAGSNNFPYCNLIVSFVRPSLSGKHRVFQTPCPQTLSVTNLQSLSPRPDAKKYKNNHDDVIIFWKFPFRATEEFLSNLK